MSEVEELIERVVKESGKTAEEIKAMMEKRKEATHGLLSDYGAIYAVAKELGVGFNNEKTVLTRLSEIEAQKPYNVAGRVKAVYQPREFNRKDGSKGKYASIFLADGSGEMRLTLWDGSAETANKVSKGDIILAKNVYGKTGRDNELELHATSLSSLEINPGLKVEVPDLPDAKTKIKDLKKDMPAVDLLCRVSSYYPPKEFNRSDGSVGSRASFIAEDETGKIRAVMWDDASKTELSDGMFVKIENGYTREGMNKELELQVGNNGRVILSEEKIKLPKLESEKEAKVGKIKPDTQNLTVAGRVLRVYKPKAYSKGMMSSFILGDKSGTLRVVLWDEKAELGGELKRGDAVKLKNVYSKTGLDGETEVHAGRYSEIAINPDLKLPGLEEVEKKLLKEKNILDLENKDTYVLIRGTIVDISDRRTVYMTCPYCNKKVQNQGLGYFCETCNQEVEPTPNLVLSFTVEDATGSIKAIAFRAAAEKIIDMDVEEVMNLIGETGDESAPVTEARERLLNQETALVGRVRYSDFSDQLEFIIEDVM